MRKIILIVDDEELNRQMLTKILEEKYSVLQACDGLEALEIVKQNMDRLDGILLDLIMPNLDGFDFLRELNKLENGSNIPVLVSTGKEDIDFEMKSLELGAWDFIRKPYNPQIIHFRLKNAIERSQLHLLKQLHYIESYDSLTGLYRRSRFQEAAREMITADPSKQYAMVRLDIAKFQLVNTFFGSAVGDNFLCKISEKIKTYFANRDKVVFGRMRADVFTIFLAIKNEQELIDMANEFREYVRMILPDFDMIPVFGFYLVKDQNMEINDMYDRAKLASKMCKGNYVTNYQFYKDEMSFDVINEQKIVNMTRPALEQEKFILYLQPKYDIQKDTIAGAEVLVRWKDTDQGMISPGEFIPVFERNGFIMELDYYVWEHSCKLIRSWLDKGYQPMPISVNVSRVSVYNPNLVEIICELVERYQIPPNLFQLELTESAYTTNPIMIRDTMSRLQEKGFTILMDDFGSGYSSLNVLKDIAVDVLKIDMKFMSETEIPGRGESILASVVNMAKNLAMPVIAEGVEKKSQVEFLQGIGCEYVQGFYYAKPMPIAEFEKLAF